jgi:hypothetical protein
LVLILAACATGSGGAEHYLRFYKGSALPLEQIAVLRNADRPLSVAGSQTPVRVELRGIDAKRFSSRDGFGEGSYEVHLLPGPHTLYLSFSAESASGVRTSSGKPQAFGFTLEAGHVYLLGGEYEPRADAPVGVWRPVMFDRTRRVTWSR